MTAGMPGRLVIAAGTYDGVLAGWEAQKDGLSLTFATAVHEGSIRCLCLAAHPSLDDPGTLLSCGYDEMLKTHDWTKRVNSSGEVRTPSDFGTPTCSSFAPPPSPPTSLPTEVVQSTHCIVGFTNGKLVLYKKRDWSVQHVLAGHEGGVASLAVHPTGKMALTGGQSDGKLKLWDLTKGRLAFVTKIPPSSMHKGKTRYDSVCSMVWSADGNSYGWAHGNHVTVRDVASGKDLLDVDLPGRVNQITLIVGQEGTFVAAACNDGSLPLLAVQDVDGEDDTRRALLAIEPVESAVAGEERFKCIHTIQGYLVVTANSAGVVSIMNLEGAVRMIMSDATTSDSVQVAKDGDSDADEDSSDDEDEDMAVDIIQSVRLGTGARITCLTVWQHGEEAYETGEVVDETPIEEVVASDEDEVKEPQGRKGMKRKSAHEANDIEMDKTTVEKARALVSQAKKLKKKRDRKKLKKSKEQGLKTTKAM